MKILFVSLLVHLLCINANGQLSKGIWLMGGSGKYYAYNSKYNSDTYSYEARYSQVDLSAELGYFNIDKLALGIKPTFTSIRGRTIPNGGRTNVQRYWIGPFARYYLLNDEKPFNLLTDISYQFGFFGGGLFKGNLRTFSILIGPEIFFNSSAGLELLLGYNYTLEDEHHFKEIRKGFQMGIGFKFHLEK
jgi:hypothetical protein